ncbi:MAG TPA: homocysteine S-methyltransferase [Gemmatimonadales bacterium]|jgi:homocysteine S-methyltransferase|nr:homocysteine S-methyltransferase [Gemmatimonadales bacterium]
MALSEILASQGFVVLDGGLATELERRGADLHDPLWSAKQLLEGPGQIRLIHEAYYAAGADVAVSASYQASLAGFGARGVTRSEARRLIALSVELAQQARQRFWDVAGRSAEGREWPLVAGSVGPYGAALADGSEYRGSYRISRQQLADFHGPRLEALVAAGPDLLAIETVPSPDEAVLVLELLQAWPQVQTWVSFTCRDEFRVSEGQPVSEAIAAVAGHPQVAAAGFNCIAPKLADGLLAAAASSTVKPLVIYPNSGERWDAEARRWLPGDEAFDFGAAAPRWLAQGARLIGGCCRTTPETIRRIRMALEEHARR